MTDQYTNQDGPEVSLPASGDLSDYQFHVMTLATDGQVKLADDADDPAEPMIGILQNKPENENDPAVIRIGGIAKAMGGDSLNEGTWVTCDGSGHVVAAVANDNVVGYTIDTMTDGEISRIMVCPGGGHVVPA